ncbi:hypothetical protein [Hyphococcus sp.]|uniref:hypothetical protein n=1 Tax=Hyphococcus sp. TaxID=2038636 RepID=UPI00375267CE
MMKKKRRLAASVAAISLGAIVFTSAPVAAQQLPGQKPLCESEREVDGWIVKAALAAEQSGDLVISKWEASRKFSTHFGFGVTFDSSANPQPTLEIWHNYKSGEFTMHNPDGTAFNVLLRSDYASTTANVPQQVIAFLRNTPVQIEHIRSGGKWTKYQTEGLPGAIAAAKADLTLAKDKLRKKECTTNQEWWRRF